MEKNESGYQLNIKRNTLYFKTTSYKAEEGSVLHSGIFNRELTSSLAAGAVLIALALLAYTKGISISGWDYAIVVAAFFAMTFLFRVFVFYEDYLELVINKGKGTINVLIKGFISKRDSISLSELAGIRKGITVIVPANADGIDVVERISLQHNMIIPGFGKVKEYTSVNLEFKNGDTFTVFATENATEATAVIEVMNNFIGGPTVA